MLFLMKIVKFCALGNLGPALTLILKIKGNEKQTQENKIKQLRSEVTTEE